jgi:hypothetical protein
MPTDIDPSDEVELVISFGTIQLLKEANKILKLFEEDEVVREIMSAINLLHESSLEYLESVTGVSGLLDDEDYDDEDENEEETAVGLEAEEDLL